MKVKATFILKNLTEAFFEGNGDTIKGINNMELRERFDYLNKFVYNGTGGVTMKIGNGQFREKVDFNHVYKKPEAKIEYKIEQRRGYQLVTYTFEA